MQTRNQADYKRISSPYLNRRFSSRYHQAENADVLHHYTQSFLGDWIRTEGIILPGTWFR